MKNSAMSLLLFIYLFNYVYCTSVFFNKIVATTVGRSKLRGIPHGIPIRIGLLWVFCFFTYTGHISESLLDGELTGGSGRMNQCRDPFLMFNAM